MINEILQCDFCSAPGPVWRYPARSFVAYCAPNIAGESVGDWAACDLCHVLIEADDRSGLAQRSLDELILKHPEAIAAAAVLREDLAELHQQFFAHRSGKAVPINANALREGDEHIEERNVIHDSADGTVCEDAAGGTAGFDAVGCDTDRGPCTDGGAD